LVKEEIVIGIARSLIKRVGTAVVTPYAFSWQSGHLRSSLLSRSVDSRGRPLPWYTFPAIDFLSSIDFSGKEVLEIGGGQSTHWWAARAKAIVTLESDKDWFEILRAGAPSNVSLTHISRHSAEQNSADVERFLSELNRKFDVVILDAMARARIATFISNYVSHEGVLICDNSDGYGIYEGLRSSNMHRVDFWGYVPGARRKQATSIYFWPSSVIMRNHYEISLPDER
jgi:hypothetical protein